MFDNGFKFAGSNIYHEKATAQASHAITTDASDDDKSDTDVKEGPSSIWPEHNRQMSVDKNPEANPGSPRRTFMSVMSDVFRRTSETSASASAKEQSDPPSRKHSQQTEVSRARGMATALGLFQSHNPDTDSEEAAAVNSPFPRKGSVISNHSGEDVPSPTPDGPQQRRPSYMPRNATASFLKTANGNSEAKQEDKEKLEQEKAAAARKPSVMGSVMGVGAGGDAAPTAPAAGRRPSGMVPNNVASRYVRTASLNEEDGREPHGSRRRSSGRKSSDAQIRAVPMQPDQFQQWQNSVQRNGSRVSFSPTALGNRQRSIDEVDEDSEVARVGSNKHTTDGNAKVVTIAVQPATPERTSTFPTTQRDPAMKQSKPMSAFMSSQISPMTATFGAEIQHDLDEITESDSRPETPLESLGFKGAVPA